jgi:flagellar biosynthesis GTPase FlhF
MVVCKWKIILEVRPDTIDPVPMTTKAKAEAEGKAEAHAEAEAETKAEAHAEAKAGAKAEAEAETKAEAEAKSEAEANEEADAKANEEAKAEAEAETKAEAEAKSEAEAKEDTPAPDDSTKSKPAKIAKYDVRNDVDYCVNVLEGMNGVGLPTSVDEYTGKRTELKINLIDDLMPVASHSLMYLSSNLCACPDALHQKLRCLERDLKKHAQYLLDNGFWDEMHRLEANIAMRGLPDFKFVIKDKKVLALKSLT